MYMDRESMIAACMKKLPYPISFYDKLSDGSLWNVYNKHIVQNIPIDRRAKKAKVENDKARRKEALQKRPEYYQITIEDYLAAPQPKVICRDGCYFRLNDSGSYDLIPDPELQDVIESLGMPVGVDEPEQDSQLTLKRTPKSTRNKRGIR